VVAPSISTAFDVVTVDNACDMLVSAEQAPPGTIIVLAGPPVHVCQVVLDAGRREVRSGQGITIQADWVTFDLNGRSIRSASNAAAQADDAGFAAGNIGVMVGGKGVTVTNSSGTAVSVVENFTTNFLFQSRGQASFASALTGKLIDHDNTPATPPVHNLVAGNAHGGGALAIEQSAHMMVDTVRLADLASGDGPPAGGSYGLYISHSEEITVRNSHIEGVRGGIRATQVRGLAILANALLSGREGSGIELGRGVRNARIADNLIARNAMNGVTVGAETAGITITGNALRENARCGIETRSGAQLANRSRLGTDNAFAANRRDLCP
jgi:parallel beta helix pectate lyase-like protein